jgi:hypothetical protein
MAVLHAVSLSAAETVKTKATNIVTKRPHRVQVTVPSQPSPLTNRVPHPPVPETPTLTLSKPLRSLA